MGWRDDMYDNSRERVWEALDALAERGVVQIGVTEMWRKHLPRYTHWPDVVFVFREASEAGVLLHPCRGVYLIAQNVVQGEPLRCDKADRCHCWVRRTQPIEAIA